MLIYGIVRVIEGRRPISTLSCTFPEGNGYIDVVFTRLNNEYREVRKIKLDPKAPTEVPLTNFLGIVT
jgi:hypothetical protein